MAISKIRDRVNASLDKSEPQQKKLKTIHQIIDNEEISPTKPDVLEKTRKMFSRVAKVYVVQENKEKEKIKVKAEGTAIAISGSSFLTAYHVVKEWITQHEKKECKIIVTTSASPILPRYISFDWETVHNWILVPHVSAPTENICGQEPCLLPEGKCMDFAFLHTQETNNDLETISINQDNRGNSAENASNSADSVQSPCCIIGFLSRAIETEVDFNNRMTNCEVTTDWDFSKSKVVIEGTWFPYKREDKICKRGVNHTCSTSSSMSGSALVTSDNVLKGMHIGKLIHGVALICDTGPLFEEISNQFNGAQSNS